MAKAYVDLCPACPSQFLSRKSAKSARSMRNRHYREHHGSKQSCKQQASLRRREDRIRKQAVRHSTKPVVCPNLVDPVPAKLLILCPRRREISESLYSKTREQFLHQGFLSKQIKRRQGIDRTIHRHVKGFEVVTKYVRHSFCREAATLFRNDEALDYVLFAEDDCQLKPKVTVRDLIRVCRKAKSDAVVGLGFGVRHGEPRVGAHLVAFSRESLPVFRRMSRTLCKITVSESIRHTAV